ncbi:MAG: site-2 protease family protein [Gammaproteobacteria bacterium]|nr:site-2 protease family protein [Gammaproteobacteria bacterium]
MGDLTLIQKIIVWILPVLFAITGHEVAHGWVAYKLGDRTAQMMGRLTLNPLKHIDLLGTIIIPGLLLLLGGFVFGWAKPVPVNYENLKHKRRDVILVAAAGCMANFIMACLWGGVGRFGVFLLHHGMQWPIALVFMGQAGILINLILMALNLLPIPPLDGSKIVEMLLPKKWAFHYERIAPYGFFILLLLLATKTLGLILMPLVNILFRLVMLIVGF